MRNLLILTAAVLLTASTVAQGTFHTFRIEALYSNADGSIQFVVMQESMGANGENLWGGRSLTSTRAGVAKVFVFPDDLPGGSSDGYGMIPSPTASKRVLIATPGFAALGRVTPDFLMPTGFLSIAGGTLDYGGVDLIAYPGLPADGIHALDRNGAEIAATATNFSGQTAAISASGPVGGMAIVPVDGLWANALEPGTGYALAYKHGVLVVAVYSYSASGAAQWYLASGPVTGNLFTAVLEKYAGGACISCPFVSQLPSTGSDGSLTISFSSPTSATVTLPGGRLTTIAPFQF